MSSPAERGVSPLDRAHALRLEGKFEDSLRLAASIAAASTEDIGAAQLLARLLLDKQRVTGVAAIATALIDRSIRRGDLLGATLAGQLSAEAGGSEKEALLAIGAAFGKGSTRVSDVSPKPPPLPTEVAVAPFFAKLSGDALLDAGEKALARFMSTADTAPANGPLPKLPLFGELAPPMLSKLLSVLKLRELKAGEYVVRQGDEGKEAFALARGVLNVVREDDTRGPVVLAALGPGSVFGEMALVSSAPRAASVVAVESSQVMVASRKELEALASKDPTIGRELGKFCHGRMVSNLMRHSAILSAVEPKKRQDLVGRFAAETFQPGDVLVREGDAAGCLFLIASGGVEVRSTDSDGDRVVLAMLGPGDVVGEISLVLRKPAMADVVAVHQTVALSLTQERFQAAIKEYPALLAELYDLATRRDEETQTVVAQEALDVSDVVLL